jgi:hypothetical protein
MKILSQFLLIILLLSGCTKDKDSLSVHNQEIFFQSDYINYAWGYQHSGWMIDSSGNVRGYNLPKDWTFADSNGIIDEIDMKKNIEQLDTLFSRIDKSILRKYIEKICDASKGDLTVPKSVMADAGSTIYSAFIFDQASKKYQQVILKQTGDLFIDNKSPEANEIYNWMINLK